MYFQKWALWIVFPFFMLLLKSGKENDTFFGLMSSIFNVVYLLMLAYVISNLMHMMHPSFFPRI